MTDLYDYLEDETEEDDYDLISPEQYEAEVMAEAQHLAQAYVAQLEADQGDDGFTDEEVEEWLLGKVGNLESALGRELTNRELQSAVDSLVNDPDGALKPDDYHVDPNDDDQARQHFIDILEDEQAAAENAEAGEYE